MSSVIEPVYEGGQMIYHTTHRGHNLEPLISERLDGDEDVTTSKFGELRLPAADFHKNSHGHIFVNVNAQHLKRYGYVP